MMPTTGQPIRAEMRADFAYAHIKRRILDGYFTSGDRLDINAFVAELKVSRQPVVRAIGQLESEGFVEIVPQVGCWVARVDRAEIGDFFRLFAVTEALAAELAATRHAAADLTELQAIDGRIAALVARGTKAAAEAHAYRMLNRAFHTQVHAMAKSTLLHTAASGMWDRCDFFLCTLGGNLIAERSVNSHREHADLIAALRDRDAVRSHRLMHDHVAGFGEAALRAAHAPGPRRRSRL